jgi:hypothetical protein
MIMTTMGHEYKRGMVWGRGERMGYWGGEGPKYTTCICLKRYTLIILHKYCAKIGEEKGGNRNIMEGWTCSNYTVHMYYHNETPMCY